MLNRLFPVLFALVLLVASFSPDTAAADAAANAPAAVAQGAVAAPTPAVATPPAARLDAEAATRAYLDRLQGEARAKSDAYFEGGYWLLLWNLLYGLVVAWLLLSTRISARIREFAERRTHRKNLQTLIYVLAWVPLGAVLAFPMTFYEGFYREHQYGLSNMTFLGWFGEQGIGLGVDMVISGIAITGLYAILRRMPQSWWAWGSVAGAGFIMLLIMAGPVFISPLFNTFTPLPEGPIRNEILSMARANGIPAENVYVSNASKQTKRVSANVSGLFGTTRITLNDNLLNRTTPAEIRAVMAGLGVCPLWRALWCERNYRSCRAAAARRVVLGLYLPRHPGAKNHHPSRRGRGGPVRPERGARTRWLRRSHLQAVRVPQDGTGPDRGIRVLRPPQRPHADLFGDAVEGGEPEVNPVRAIAPALKLKHWRASPDTFALRGPPVLDFDIASLPCRVFLSQTRHKPAQAAAPRCLQSDDAIRVVSVWGGGQMRRFSGLAVMATVMLLGGCLSVDLDYANRTLLAQGKLATGTRLAKPTTERVIKAVGNKEYTEQNQHLGIANQLTEASGGGRK